MHPKKAPSGNRTRGVIISYLQGRQQLEDIIKADPFHLNDVANYEIIDFNPTKIPRPFCFIHKIDLNKKLFFDIENIKNNLSKIET